MDTNKANALSQQEELELYRRERKEIQKLLKQSNIYDTNLAKGVEKLKWLYGNEQYQK